MTVRAAFRRLLCAAVPVVGSAAVLLGAPIEKSLLTPDGTLYVVQAGTAADLGVAGSNILPSDFIIEWTARRQDGTVEVGIIPGTANRNAKRR